MIQNKINGIILLVTIQTVYAGKTVTKTVINVVAIVTIIVYVAL